MNKELVDQLNEQINLEMVSAYLYFDMSVVLEERGFPGYVAWLRHQAEEEMEHAEKIIEFLLARGESPRLKSIELEKIEDYAPLSIAHASLKHEKLVSESIRQIRKAALEAGDQEVETFLNWFIDEQVEEEDTAQTNVDLLEFAGDNPAALLHVDAILGKRD